MKNEQVLAPNEAGELKNIFSPKNIVFENVKKIYISIQFIKHVNTKYKKISPTK